jgi:hypothetical protein
MGLTVASALDRVTRTSPIYQNAPHQLRAHGEEVSAVLPACLLGIDQPQVGLVHQSGGLQRVIGTFVSHVTLGQPV